MEKNEALESIRAIRSVMADGDGPLPVPPGSMIVWGLVSAFLIFTVPEIYETPGPTPAQKSLWAFGLMALATLLGSLLDYRYVKKENEKLDRVFSRNQRMTTLVYALSVIGGILFTITLAATSGWPVVYYVWPLFIGIASVVGGFFSSRLFVRFGLFLFVAGAAGIGGGMVLLLGSGSAGSPEWNQTGRIILDSGQWIAALLLGGGHTFLGFYLLKKRSAGV